MKILIQRARQSLLLSGLSLVAALTSAQLAIAGELSIRPAGSLKPEYLWSAVEPNIFSGECGLVVAFWPASDESLVFKDDFKFLGFALVGLGDIGEIPVAAEIWAKGLAVAKNPVSEDETGIAINLVEIDCSGSQECERRKVAVSLLNRGDDSLVLIDGAEIGAIRSWTNSE